MGSTDNSNQDVIDNLMESDKFKTFMSAITKDLKSTLEELVKPLHERINQQDSRIQNLTDQLERKDGEIHELEVKHAKLEEKHKELMATCDECTGNTDSNADAIEELQAYSRRQCVIISGVKESQGENTDDIVLNLANEHMKMSMKPEDIDRSHRLGKHPRDGKPRPIVAKFVRFNVRAKFIASRKLLKGTGVGVQEHVTPYVSSISKRAKQLVNTAPWVQSTWIWNGKVNVFVKPHDWEGYKKTINSNDDLDKIWHTYVGYYNRVDRVTSDGKRSTVYVLNDNPKILQDSKEDEGAGEKK